MKPSVGRIVHYREPPTTVEDPAIDEGAPPVSPAIIIKVYDDETVALTVFNHTGGTSSMDRVRYSEDPVFDTWGWPPRV